MFEWIINIINIQLKHMQYLGVDSEIKFMILTFLHWLINKMQKDHKL